jgi:hypothetical protein
MSKKYKHLNNNDKYNFIKKEKKTIKVYLSKCCISGKNILKSIIRQQFL